MKGRNEGVKKGREGREAGISLWHLNKGDGDGNTRSGQKTVCRQGYCFLEGGREGGKERG